jgi:hypothetical protein
MRTLAVVFLVFFIANTKVRLHGLIWILVISLGYYGVKGEYSPSCTAETS